MFLTPITVQESYLTETETLSLGATPSGCCYRGRLAENSKNGAVRNGPLVFFEMSAILAVYTATRCTNPISTSLSRAAFVHSLETGLSFTRTSSLGSKLSCLWPLCHSSKPVWLTFPLTCEEHHEPLQEQAVLKNLGPKF